MACNCKHCRQEIKEGYKNINELRDLFIKRMTVDSETQDKRRKDYNQALFTVESDDDIDEWNAEVDRLTAQFGYFNSYKKKYGRTYQNFTEITLDMILTCFDNAVKDWRKSFCDVENCTRK